MANKVNQPVHQSQNKMSALFSKQSGHSLLMVPDVPVVQVVLPIAAAGRSWLLMLRL